MVASSFEARACSACSLDRARTGRRELVRVVDDLLQRAVLRDELSRGLVADARDAGNVVARIALEPDEVGHLVGANPVAGLDSLGCVHVHVGDAPRGHHQADVLGDELERIPVGGDDARLDPGCVRARCEGRDHVVRLPALELEVLVPECLDDRPEVRELLAQEIRHRTPLGLVLGGDLGAMHRARVPRHRDASRLVVRQQLEQHVREAEERIRRLSIGRLELLRQCEERSVGEVVPVDEEELRLVDGSVVEVELLTCQRLRRHPATVSSAAACVASRFSPAPASFSFRPARTTSCSGRRRLPTRSSMSARRCAMRCAFRSPARRSMSSRHVAVAQRSSSNHRHCRSRARPRIRAREALATTIDELERCGIPDDRQTILAAGALGRRSSVRELVRMLLRRRGRARFTGELLVHDAEDPALVPIDAGDEPSECTLSLRETDLTLAVGAAETVVHGGPGHCSLPRMRAPFAGSRPRTRCSRPPAAPSGSSPCPSRPPLARTFRSPESRSSSTSRGSRVHTAAIRTTSKSSSASRVLRFGRCSRPLPGPIRRGYPRAARTQAGRHGRASPGRLRSHMPRHCCAVWLYAVRRSRSPGHAGRRGSLDRSASAPRADQPCDGRRCGARTGPPPSPQRIPHPPGRHARAGPSAPPLLRPRHASTLRRDVPGSTHRPRRRTSSPPPSARPQTTNERSLHTERAARAIRCCRTPTGRAARPRSRDSAASWSPAAVTPSRHAPSGSCRATGSGARSRWPTVSRAGGARGDPPRSALRALARRLAARAEARRLRSRRGTSCEPARSAGAPSPSPASAIRPVSIT